MNTKKRFGYFNAASLVIIIAVMTGNTFTAAATPLVDVTGNISGRVVDASGIPIDNIDVLAIPLSGGYRPSGNTGYGNDGYYVIDGLAYGEYKVVAGGILDYCREGWPAKGPCQYAREYYDGSLDGTIDGEFASVLTVDVTHNPPQVDFMLDPGTTVSGRVTDPAGNPLPNISVTVVSPYYAFGTCTNSNGEYIFGGMLAAPMVNRLAAGGSKPWCSGRALWQYQDYLLDSDQIIDWTLARGGDLQVMVQDPAGNPIEDAIVHVFDAVSGDSVEDMVPMMLGVHNTFPRTVTIKPGAVNIYVDAPAGFISQYYDNAYTQNQAASVTISENEMTSVTIVLKSLSEINFQWLSPLANIANGSIYQMNDGSTLPLKFTIKDSHNNFVVLPNIVVVVWKVNYTPGSDVAFRVGSGDANMRIAELDKQYIINLHTKNYAWMQAGEECNIGVFLVAPLPGENNADWQWLGRSNFQLVEGGKAKK